MIGRAGGETGATAHATHATVIKLAGGHHFGGSYEHLADVILSGSAGGGGGPDHAVQ